MMKEIFREILATHIFVCVVLEETLQGFQHFFEKCIERFK